MGTDEEFKDDQNFDVNIDEVYKKYIADIDNIRSKANKQGNIDKDFQESRCHAFYRFLGLPVVASDGQTLYSPGNDIPNNSNLFFINYKKQVVSKISKDMFKLMDARENLPQYYLSIFAAQDINASYLAMGSSQTRYFSSPFPESDADPFDIDAAKNSIFSSPLGVSLKETIFDSANEVNPTVNFSQRQHILKPFMVDPRIDDSVNPRENRIRVPFLTNKNEAKLRENVFLQGPYIETVCRERFNISSKSLVVGENTKKIIENIKKGEANISEENKKLFESIFNPDLIYENVYLANNINIIRSMLKKLVASIVSVQKVLSADPDCHDSAEYNWVPIPNSRGPEYGNKTRGIMDQQADISNKQKDRELIDLIYAQQITDMNNKFKAQDKAVLGKFAFDDIGLADIGNSSNSWGDKREDSIADLQKQRQALTDQANLSLREIEIIMGEFSGLGLCDILAITTALWIVDKTTLLNLLDDISIERMAKDPNLQSAEVLARNQQATMTPIVALTNFELKVKEVFELMDSMYDDIVNSS